jgi:predicted nucleic acid-binding protein
MRLEVTGDQMVFCDTSTLAKYYVPEAETVVVQSRLDGEDQVMASELARVELMAVFHRRLREGKWNAKEFQAVVRQFSKDDIGGYWYWAPLDSSIVEEAVTAFTTLPESIYLGSAGCLHLVTALHHNFDEIYTHDLHQQQAASAFGLNFVCII